MLWNKTARYQSHLPLFLRGLDSEQELGTAQARWKKSKMRVLYLLLGIFFFAKGALGDNKNEEESSALATEDSLDAKDSSQKERLFGSFSTTTYTIVSAITSTVFFSCLSGTAATVCQGRNSKRFRRGSDAKALELADGEDSSLPALESSGLEEPSTEDRSATGEFQAKDPKFGFTVWTTARTTTSVTVFYTNRSTTIRLSYYCIAGGLQFPPQNCAG
ncbi:uncharacterized protein [Macrobrachium rosenbergii]|uniref:uncharacterized protein n=1 Tax=Macrobrachium rosenbergii TaxID=79674 RepID=UPI0034D670E5